MSILRPTEKTNHKSIKQNFQWSEWPPSCCRHSESSAKQRFAENNKYVNKAGAILVVAANFLHAIGVLDLQVHEDKMTLSCIKIRTVFCRVQAVSKT